MTALGAVAVVAGWMSGVAVGCWLLSWATGWRLEQEDYAFGAVLAGSALVLAVLAGCL